MHSSLVQQGHSYSDDLYYACSAYGATLAQRAKRASLMVTLATTGLFGLTSSVVTQGKQAPELLPELAEQTREFGSPFATPHWSNQLRTSRVRSSGRVWWEVGTHRGGRIPPDRGSWWCHHPSNRASSRLLLSTPAALAAKAGTKTIPIS